MLRPSFFLLLVTINISVAARPRARDLGIPFEGTPGRYNAITDVKGVEVGHVTLNSGQSKVGNINGVIRTGVTAVWPAGKETIEGVPAAWYTLNGNGEMTGVAAMDESGLLEGPVLMTNTQSVGVVRDSTVEWFVKKFPIVEEAFLTVVGETDDSWLNDLYGFHVKKEHVFQVLEKASGGPVAEGSVGAGTGDVSFHFKAGIGTASRKVDDGYTVGVLVQSNFGHREELQIAGIPIGKEITDMEIVENPFPKMYPFPKKREERSIVVVIATDAPLLPHQLKRLAKRAPLGMGRLGSLGRNSSGEFFVAFSTAKPKRKGKLDQWSAVQLKDLDPLFYAAVQATEEAIVNALAAGETMEGVNGNKVFGLPWDRALSILKRHNRLNRKS